MGRDLPSYSLSKGKAKPPSSGSNSMSNFGFVSSKSHFTSLPLLHEDRAHLPRLKSRIGEEYLVDVHANEALVMGIAEEVVEYLEAVECTHHVCLLCHCQGFCAPEGLSTGLDRAGAEVGERPGNEMNC